MATGDGRNLAAAAAAAEDDDDGDDDDTYFKEWLHGIKASFCVEFRGFFRNVYI